MEEERKETPERPWLRADPTRQRRRLLRKLTRMAAGRAAAHLEAESVRQLVRAALYHDPVPTIQYPAYYSYALQFQKRLRTYGPGKSLDIEAGALRQLWQTRGLEAGLLLKIRDAIVKAAAERANQPLVRESSG